MRHLPSTLFFVSSLGLAVSSAYAQDGQSQAGGQQGQASIQEVLTEFDEDSNQRLSQEEFEKLYDEKLQSAGTAGGAAQSGGAEQMFGEIDADGDEQLTSEELSASTALQTQLDQDTRQASTQSAQGQSSSSSAAALGAATGAVGAAAADSQSQSERDTAGAQQSERAGSQSSQIGAANQSSQSSQSSTRELGQSQSSQSTAQDRQQTSQTTPGSSSQSAATAGVGSQGQAGSSQLERMAMTQPDEIKGKSVKSTAGEDLGEVSDLVRSRDDGSVYAVIESGGVLGIGANRAAVKLSELEMEGEELVYPSSREQLEQMNYQEAQYEPLDESGDQQASIDQSAQPDVAVND